MMFAPCAEVGGKRFSFLSHYLAGRFDEYHVLARKEVDHHVDASAYTGSVHRLPAWPRFPPRSTSGIWYKLARVWHAWLCVIDPYIGWTVPAIWKGIRLCRERNLNVVIVTVPYFSSLIAAVVIAKACSASLIIDYRDPMTGLRRDWPKPFGAWASRLLERLAIQRARAIVFCSDIMRDDFVRMFGELAADRLEVIYNGFVSFEPTSERSSRPERVEMVYAGEFYGTRRLSIIAPALREMLVSGEITAQTFRFHIYAKLRPEDHQLIRDLGIEALVDEHPRLAYDAIKLVMGAADVLFLPSGSDVPYAVPFKFFDYLSARRPILAVAPAGSSVEHLMRDVDCGEFALLDDTASIRSALRRLIRREKEYSFKGAERFLWSNAAAAYFRLIEDVTSDPTINHDTV